MHSHMPYYYYNQEVITVLSANENTDERSSSLLV